MKRIEEPRKIIITALVAIALAVIALTWHSIKILPQYIKQAGEEALNDKSGP